MQKFPSLFRASFHSAVSFRRIGQYAAVAAVRRFSAVVQPPVADATPQSEATPEKTPESSEATTKKPLTFGRFVLYATGALASAGFSYYFYQAGGNLHTTEILISRKLAQLPFYYPPGPSVSERNASIPKVEIPAGLMEQQCAWFIYQDTALKEGVTRADVLELFGKALGLVDPETEGSAFGQIDNKEFTDAVSKLVKSFVEKGRGRLTEYKRQSGVSLQESLELLNDLILLHQRINPNIAEEASAALHAVLGKLVDVQNSAALPGFALSRGIGSDEVMPEVEADEKELLEMELGQAKRAREALANRGTLSEAEAVRLKELERGIGEITDLIKRISK